MSRDISELLPDILVCASGCPEFLALQSLSSTVREFLEYTNAWKQWADPIDIVADQAVYAFPNHLLDDTEKWVRTKDFNIVQWEPTGKEIEFRTPEQLQALDPEWRTRTGAVPYYYTNELNDAAFGRSLRLYPVPSEAVTDGLKAELILSTHTYAGVGLNANDELAVELPDYLFEKYRDDFVNGTVARLLRIPKRDWSDIRASDYYRGLFESAKISAKSEADVNFGMPVLTVKYGGY